MLHWEGSTNRRNASLTVPPRNCTTTHIIQFLSKRKKRINEEGALGNPFQPSIKENVATPFCVETVKEPIQPRQPIQVLFIQFYVFAQGRPQFAGKCLHFYLNNVHYILHIQERVCNLEKELRIPPNSSQAPLKQSLQ